MSDNLGRCSLVEQFKADLLRWPFVLFSWVLDAYWAHHCLVFIDASVV